MYIVQQQLDFYYYYYYKLSILIKFFLIEPF
jgi:hypothetical protein